MKPWSTLSNPVLQHLPALATSAVVIAAGTGLVMWWVRTHRTSANEVEHQRRNYLVHAGRVIDGTILDAMDQPNSGDLTTLHYQYAIAGVSYECAQDLKDLKDKVQVDASCLGMPASVRYDPKNPANSIVVAEAWTGLRHYKRPQPSQPENERPPAFEGLSAPA